MLGSDHHFLRWGKLGDELCSSLSGEVFDRDQQRELKKRYWAGGTPKTEASVAFDFLYSSLAEYRRIMHKKELKGVATPLRMEVSRRPSSSDPPKFATAKEGSVARSAGLVQGHLP